jgi:hypothetical protein
MKRFVLLAMAAMLLAAPVQGAHGNRRPSHCIHRSLAARAAFMRRTGFRRGRPGYVIDHIIPLACGGADDPDNMQWQTTAEAKAKDKWERRGCR